MSEQQTFGRRRLQASAPAPPVSHRVEAEDPLALSGAAEAFRSTLAEAPREGSQFQAWRRDQRGRRLVAWTLRLALFTPGVVCLALQTPWYVSGGLELAGLGVGVWLRYERQRHLREIAEWGSDPC